MKHHVVKPAPGNAIDSLRNDPALRAIYRCKTLAELDAKIASLTNAQRQVALDGLLRLAWLNLRKNYSRNR
jgi:hypothetical protein